MVLLWHCCEKLIFGSFILRSVDRSTSVSRFHTYIYKNDKRNAYLASMVIHCWHAVLGKGSEHGNGPNPEYPPIV